LQVDDDCKFVEAHAVAPPYVPSAPQIATPSPTHWRSPGAQLAQAPLRHTGVVPEQVDWACQLPFASQS
jgi:hypothetical protein